MNSSECLAASDSIKAQAGCRDGRRDVGACKSVMRTCKLRPFTAGDRGQGGSRVCMVISAF